MKVIPPGGTLRSASRLPRASTISLAVSLLFPVAASAGEYYASDFTSLVAAITAANADGDTSAIIRLTSDISIPGTIWATPAPAKTITIDTNGFVMSKSSSVGNYLTSTAGTLIFNGTYVGTASSAASAYNGMFLSGGGLAINNGTVTGGDSLTATASGGTGISVSLNTDLINNGSIKGGNAAGTAVNGGIGVTLSTGATLVNSATGLIEGGEGANGIGGVGVAFTSTIGGSLVNYGTIRGGTDPGSGKGGIGVRLAGGNATIDNSGLIEAGAGSAAILVNNTGGNHTVINAGTIRAGTGYANAIEFSQGTGTATLELRAGSNIIGNVLANPNLTTNTFRLGGDTNGVFDVSSIGDTAQYRYFNTFIKTGASTWALVGDGTVSAPWTVNQGTLQIGNGGASGSLAGDVVVNSAGTLAFNRADTYTYNGLISGAGGVTQSGTGTTVLTAANTYTGATSINLGTLAINGSINSAVAVAIAGTLAGTGKVYGDVTNSGTVAPSGTGILTIDGNYITNGGTVRVNTTFDGDNAATGRLVVTGGTSGSGLIRAVRIAGSVAPTVEGIKVVDVQGASNAVFKLAGDYTYQGTQAVVAGAYAYRLYQGGISTPADGDWYLRSSLVETDTAGTTVVTPLLAPTVPLYEAYAGILQRFNAPGTFQQRASGRSWSDYAVQEAGKPGVISGAWARIEGETAHINPAVSTTGSNYNVRAWKFETGIDMPVYDGQSGTLVLAPIFQYGMVNASIASKLGNGSINATSYGLGGAATWYGNNGSYVDTRATVNRYDSDIQSADLGVKLAKGNRATGLSTSVEGGHKLPLGNGWSVTPQAQLSWSQVRFNGFDDQYGASVSGDKSESLVLRMGASLDHEIQWSASNGKTNRSHVYGIGNLYYDFKGDASATVSNVSVNTKEQSLWAGVGVGASLNWDDDRYAVYGEALVRASVQDFADSNALGARVGLRMKW